ncbi:MAG: PEP-CTERM sorting domain-containing protein [Dehalococcoidia bacterium]
MRMRALLISAMVVLAAVVIGCPDSGPKLPPMSLEFDFRDGEGGWEAGFAEYAPDMEETMQLEAGIRPLPSELEMEGTGFYVKGNNSSDDLFMFLKRRLGADDGLTAGQEYRVEFTIVFASNAPSGAAGIGGAPGESVFLKAGACAVEPEAHLDPAMDYYLMNVDKGEGNSGEGPAATVAGNIANGLPAEEVDPGEAPYVSVERSHVHTYSVTAGPEGELWLLVGTDSGFEGLTAIYYQCIEVTLTPVSS